jgi:LPXTG-motif cell wall-anchored protein
VNRTSLTRRIFAGAAGLMIGGAAALALAAPAHATQGGPHSTEISYSDVEFLDVCEGTYVYVKSGNVIPSYEWTITVAGEEFWSDTLAAGENNDLAPALVPNDAGEISVDFKFSPDDTWPKTHTWADPGDCEEPDPDPDPDPEPPLTGEVIWEFDCETITLTITNTTEVDEDLTVVPSEGDPVEVTVPAGGEVGDISFASSEGLTIDILLEGESVLDEPIEITSEEWAELGCPDEEPPGAGGELPTTGNTTMLIAGGAVALLALGGGLFLVARRRQVTFTA